MEYTFFCNNLQVFPMSPFFLPVKSPIYILSSRDVSTFHRLCWWKPLICGWNLHYSMKFSDNLRNLQLASVAFLNVHQLSRWNDVKCRNLWTSQILFQFCIDLYVSCLCQLYPISRSPHFIVAYPMISPFPHAMAAFIPLILCNISLFIPHVIFFHVKFDFKSW